MKAIKPQLMFAVPQPVRRRITWTTLPAGVRRTVLVLILIGLWQAYVTLSKVPPTLVASPGDVISAMSTDFGNGTIPQAAINTLQTLLLGMTIGIIGGFLLASFAVLSQFGHDLLSMLVAILNPLPSIAILPLAMIWFGLTTTSIVFVVVHATIWPIAISTDTGFRTISPTTHMVARNLGLRGVRMLKDVLLPSALPYIVTGLKSAWAFGWRTIVAAELVFGVAGEAGGLGWYINNNRYFLNTANVFAGLVVISILGILVELLFTYFEKKTIIRWGMKKAR